MNRSKNSYVFDACKEHGMPLPSGEVSSVPHADQFADDIVVQSMLRAFAGSTDADLAHAQYFEIGATHPILDSATFLLQAELGMSGVLVAASDACLPDLERVRAQDKIILAQDQQTPGAAVQGILNDHFPDADPVFLSLRAQEMVQDILGAFPFAQRRPYLVQVGLSDAHGDTKKDQAVALLEKNGYAIVGKSPAGLIAADVKRLKHPPQKKELRFYPTQWRSDANVHHAISAHDYVSIDIFDTLLFRHCKAPKDAFSFMAGNQKVKDVTDFFRDTRVAAEQLAREDAAEKGAEDVSLDEIYTCFRQLTNCTLQQQQQIKELELQTEVDLLAPTNFGQQLINHLRETKKRFVVTSDMYLPQGFLETVLEQKGVTGWERVFVSNVVGRSKHTGTLYRDVTDHFGVPAEKILHIGDNRHADGKRAAEAGLKPHIVPASKDLPARSRRAMRQTNLLKGTRPISQVFIANYLEKHQFDADQVDFQKMSDDAYFEAFGAVLIAPLFASFMIWMKQKMDQRNIDRAVFLARDGMFPKQVFDLLWPTGYQTEYAAASRRVLTVPFTVLKPDTIQNMFRGTLERSATLEDFLTKVAAGPSLRKLFSDQDLWDANPMTRKHTKRALDLLKENPEALFAAFEDERAIHADYYRSLFPRGSRSALFDLGWRGSLQRSICEILGNEASVIGHYFGTKTAAIEILQRDGLEYESFAVKNGLPNATQPWVDDFRDVMEFLCSADHGSVLRIDRNEHGDYSWHTADVPDLEANNFDIAGKIQKAALAAIASVTRTMPVEVLEKYVSNKDESDLRNFLSKPHGNDARRFQNVRVFVGVGDTTGESLTRIGEKKSHYSNVKRSRWRTAYAAQLNWASRAWVKFRLRKRKHMKL